MAITSISQERFSALAMFARHPTLVLTSEELEWFADDHERVLGVVTRHREDQDYTSQTVLVSSTEQLLAFPLEDGDFSVLEIQLVSPGWINGTGRWKMEPLTEIWRAREKESGQLADIFVLQNRSRYAVTALGPVESELDNPRLVARFN